MFKLICSSLLVVLNTFATTPCIDPFSGSHTEFTLTEQLSGNPTQAQYSLTISPGTYLKPSCIGNRKVLDLYLNNGANIRSFSNEQVGDSGWGALEVSSACTGLNLFTIEPNYQMPGIGSVNPNENTVNNVVLRNNQSQVIANATKRLISEGSGGKAIWSVSNEPDLSPQVMSYLLALKDNKLFSCDSSAPLSRSSSDSTGLVIGIVVGTFAAIPATILIIRIIWQKCPWFFKRKTYEPPSNQGESLQPV